MQAMQISKDLIPVPEAAELLHVGRQTVWNWLSDGRLQRVKVFGKTFCKLSEVESILKDSYGN
ncbi:MAG: helix-turn-helix domain-containing protein [SAR324 cluster bacterium]|nr:helix-turn-helix domain-containing protein [SAR324 cluster bacterium]